jgi:hypothetical protein
MTDTQLHLAGLKLTDRFNGYATYSAYRVTGTHWERVGIGIRYWTAVVLLTDNPTLRFVRN